MLTKQDLQDINKLLKPPFKEIQEEIKDLEDKMDSQFKENYVHIFRVEKDLKEEIKSIKRKLRDIYQNQNEIIGHFDKEFQGLRNRVEKVEATQVIAHRIKK